MEKKVAIFDIDKTLIRIDSMFYFLWFGIKKRPLSFFNLFKVVLYTLLYKLKIIELEKAKEPYFYAVNYMTNDDLERFFEFYLKPNIYAAALDELKSRKKDGYLVLLVTASPFAYMKYFKSIPYVDEVLGSELLVEEGKYTNKIVGKNCKGEEKVRRIQLYLQNNGYSVDYDNSVAYSDSLTDRPIFSLVKHRYLINRKSPGLEELTWT